MKRTFAKTVAVVGVSFAAGLLVQTLAVASPAPAGAGQEGGSAFTVAKDQIRKRDRPKDGSCLVSKDQIRKRDRPKDGSCQYSQDQIRKRDRKRDGSCKS